MVNVLSIDMPEQELENWMHASDEERISMHDSWDVSKGEGKHIAEGIAALLERECVYNVSGVTTTTADGKWQILAYADSDYDSLKDRDIDFLGFKLVIEKA